MTSQVKNEFSNRENNGLKLHENFNYDLKKYVEHTSSNMHYTNYENKYVLQN